MVTTRPATARGPAAVAEELGRHLGIEPEAALHAANAKFTARFQQVEAALADSGREAEKVSLEELDRLWEEAKCVERRPPESGTGVTDLTRDE